MLFCGLHVLLGAYSARLLERLFQILEYFRAGSEDILSAKGGSVFLNSVGQFYKWITGLR